MKALFILFFCIIFLTVIGAAKKKEKMEVMQLNQSQVIDFNGTLFLPMTLQSTDDSVKGNFIVLRTPSKKYTFVKCYNRYCLSGPSREVPVLKGQTITSTAPVKLFFAREL